MILGVPAGEIATLAVMILLGGIAAGVLAGVLGVGGGAAIVPVLYEIFRTIEVPEAVRMQLCVGTSLAIIVPAMLRSYLTHRTGGLVLKDVVRTWVVPALIGVAAGSAIAAVAPPTVFRLAFVILATLMGVRLLLNRESWGLGTELPGPVSMNVFGFSIGLVSSLMGVGAGGISTAVLTLYGKHIHDAIGVAAALGVPVTIAGAAGYMIAGWQHQALMPPLSIGFVSLIGFGLIAPVSSFVSPYAARLSRRLSRRRLEILFGLFLLAVSARFLLGLIL